MQLKEFEIRKKGNTWQVVGHKGDIKGTHDSEEAAKKQIAAIYTSGYKESIKKYFEEKDAEEDIDDALLKGSLISSVEQAFNRKIDIPENLRTRIHNLGVQNANKITDLIFDSIKAFLVKELQEMNYSPSEEELEAYDGSLVELVEETDAFMMLTADLCREYLEGMEQAWPHTLLN